MPESVNVPYPFFNSLDDFEVTSVRMGPLVADSTWVEGLAKDGRSSAIVLAENPRCYGGAPFTDEDLESRMVRRLMLDFDARGGGSPFANPVRNFADPPDFHVDLVSARLGRNGALWPYRAGLECTRWASPRRRGLHAQFRRVQSALLTHGGEFSPGLEGRLVMVRLGDGAGAVPRLTSPDAQEIASAVASMTPSPQGWEAWTPGDDPPVPEITTASGFEIFVTTMPPSHQPTSTAKLLRFECVPMFNEVVAHDDVQQQLLDVIKRKDVPGNEMLLLNVGAPGKDGWAYPAEEALIRPIVEERMPDIAGSYQLEHLKMVLLHRWHHGDIFEFYPTGHYRCPGPGEAAMPTLPQGVGLPKNPNEPCPCGSGRKYKRCHAVPTPSAGDAG